MNKGGFVFILSTLLFGVFFCGQNIFAASLPEVQINEVAWMGTTVSYTKEWIELKNNSTEVVDLAGWSLKISATGVPINLSGSIPGGGFYLMERTSDESVPNETADLIYKGDLSNNGTILELKNSLGTVIDSMDLSTGWPAGNNTTKNTMERDAAGNWLDSKVGGGTPRLENSVFENSVVVVPGEGQPTSPQPSPLEGEGVIVTGTPAQPANNNSIILPNKIVPQIGEIAINEFVSDPNDGDSEWVEVYLNSSREFDVSGWTLEDGSKTKTLLAGKLSGLSKYLIIENPKGALNNTGDVIILRDEKGVILDQVTYGNWNGSTGIEAPRDGRSLARIFDGVTSFNNYSDFVITETPTQGAANKIVGQTGNVAVTTKPVNYKDLVISELAPNPAGDDAGEWLEIWNKGASSIDLKDWRISIDDKNYKFASGTVASGQYIVLPRAISKLVLTNTSGTIKLYPPGSQSASQSVYYKEVRENQSYSLDADNLWSWSLTMTPGAKNIIKKTNEPPEVQMYFETPAEVGELVLFDSSDTNDIDGDSLSYLWQFGDGATSSLANPQHVYGKTGSYKIKMQVSDGIHKVIEEKNIKVIKPVLPLSQLIFDVKNSQVVVNEFVANPSGTDDEEWIELYNKGKGRVNLLGWQLDDEEGGSGVYKIEEDVWLEPGGFIVFERSETNLALNNNQDSVRLFDGAGKLVDQVNYPSAKDDLAMARDLSGEWQWTSVSTPGEANVINYTPEAKGEKQKAKKSTTNTTKKLSDLVKVNGVVTSLPGELGSQFFYVQNETGGFQIYNYKKEFPVLKIGDQVEVGGVQSEINMEVRIKTAKVTDIKVLKNNVSVEPQKAANENLNENYLSQLLIIEGEVTKKSGSTIYMDDGTEEALVYLKQSTGLKSADFKVGEKYSIVGVLTKTKTAFRLLPRSISDVVAVGTKEEQYGVVATNSSETLSPGSPYEKTIAYASVLGGGSFILLAGWVIRKKMSL